MDGPQTSHSYARPSLTHDASMKYPSTSAIPEGTETRDSNPGRPDARSYDSSDPQTKKHASAQKSVDDDAEVDADDVDVVDDANVADVAKQRANAKMVGNAGAEGEEAKDEEADGVAAVDEVDSRLEDVGRPVGEQEGRDRVEKRVGRREDRRLMTSDRSRD